MSMGRVSNPGESQGGANLVISYVSHAEGKELERRQDVGIAVVIKPCYANILSSFLSVSI